MSKTAIMSKTVFQIRKQCCAICVPNCEKNMCKVAVQYVKQLLIRCFSRNDFRIYAKTKQQNQYETYIDSIVRFLYILNLY